MPKASVGTNSPAKFPEYLGSAQYAELYNEARMNMGVDPSSPDLFSTNVIEDFKNGKIDILISTTVIEVGVDVPNANIMIIENAERFGLATLHQLRGRVGRGTYKSYCILKYKGKSDVIKQRMEIMTKTNDGFVVSEKDLELRGSGEFFGTKQHGIPEFKIANLFEDIETLKSVQSVAIKIIEEDSKLESEKNARLKKQVDDKFGKRVEI